MTKELGERKMRWESGTWEGRKKVIQREREGMEEEGQREVRNMRGCSEFFL